LLGHTGIFYFLEAPQSIFLLPPSRAVTNLPLSHEAGWLASHWACATRVFRDRALHEHRRPSSLPSHAPSKLACFSLSGSSQAVLHCAHRMSTVSSCAFCEQEEWSGYSLPPICGEFQRFVKPGVSGPLSEEGLAALKMAGPRTDSYPYSTSTVMVWVAVTRSWSFVAPFTVIL